ncbi:response regulator transcription factor [Rhizobium sp. ARZ01]|uniref:response regulator transcription factor n=1 Tax=Rhizobium sp. ARZ01 TaxID=2769313 RepID=UPI00177F99F4|nr:response regulator [Rhizobium sp. ARZ01]MBD9375365.1 response regulator transcription factor [Rhizobium sp. ARZ01]
MNDIDAPLVLIVDDDEAMRSSMAFLFSSVGLEAKVHASAAELLAELPPDESVRPGVLVLDVRMPEMSGLELQRRLVNSQFPLPIIFVTGHGDVPIAVETLKVGAFDFIEKPFKEQYLLDSVAAAIQLSRTNLALYAQRRSVEEKLSRLGRREVEVMNGVLAGKPNKVIAHELDLSIKSIEVYRASVMSKMQASSLVELARLVDALAYSNTR